MGLGDEHIVNPGAVSATLRCSICTDVYADPVYSSGKPCQHVFCRACIDEALRQRKKCPMCSLPLQPQNLEPHLVMRSLLGELLVRCSAGCGWTGRQDAQSSHLEDCPARTLRKVEQQLAKSSEEVNNLRQQVARKDRQLTEKDARILELEALLGLDAPRKKQRPADEETEEARPLEQELKQHAAAITQHYARLIHQWEPLMRMGESSGNPHDQACRKVLSDPALFKFELFLYRQKKGEQDVFKSEQDVFKFMLAQSIDTQRKERHWRAEDEGRILFHLGDTLKAHNCYSSMLREKPAAERNGVSQSELLPLDMTKLAAEHKVVLMQAHITMRAKNITVRKKIFQN